MRVLKLVLFFLIIFPLGFLLWMNLTPGYFQYGECGCSVGYYTDDQVTVKKTKNTPDELFLPPTICQCAAQSKTQTFIGAIELLLAKLDLYRGPGASEVSPKNYDQSSDMVAVAGYLEYMPESRPKPGEKPVVLLRIDDEGAFVTPLVADVNTSKLIAEKISTSPRGTLSKVEGSYDPLLGTLKVQAVEDLGTEGEAFQWQEIKIDVSRPRPVTVAWYFGRHVIKYLEDVGEDRFGISARYLRFDINGIIYQFGDYRDGIERGTLATVSIEEEREGTVTGVTYQVLGFKGNIITLRARQWAKPPVFIPSASAPSVSY